MGQRSLVSYFGLVAWPVTETKSDKSRLGEAAEGRTAGITGSKKPWKDTAGGMPIFSPFLMELLIHCFPQMA